MIYSINLLARALHICIDVHKDDRDSSNMPYALHPIRVMQKQETMACRIVALLHDTIEMHPERISAEQIRREFGESIFKSVVAITQKGNEQWNVYIDRILQNKDAALVKLADLEDNMNPRRMDDQAVLKLKNFYLPAHHFICKEYQIV